jgi:hypothetical protein
MSSRDKAGLSSADWVEALKTNSTAKMKKRRSKYLPENAMDYSKQQLRWINKTECWTLAPGAIKEKPASLPEAGP